MDSANRFSASIPKELIDSVSIRDYLEGMTDDIAQKIAISDKVGDQTVKIKGRVLIKKYPTSNKTIYLDLDKFITVGAGS